METKSTYLEKKIVLEGCNGDWAQKHYLPPLLEKAAKGAIELWAVDRKDNVKLGGLQKDWQAAQSEEGQTNLVAPVFCQDKGTPHCL